LFCPFLPCGKRQQVRPGIFAFKNLFSGAATPAESFSGRAQLPVPSDQVNY
jgi:hypothetical protein